jgi:hypothetical protein
MTLRNLKEEILQVTPENFMEKILDVVNQNVKQELNIFHMQKMKNMRRHRKK